jgi:hypothetical protein
VPGRLSDVNPVAIASTWLEADPLLLAAFADAGADPLLGVPLLGVVRPPYPMLRVVKTPGGNLGDLRWRTEPELQVEVWGDLDGTPGPAALERILLVALERLKALELYDYQPWEPVVTHVRAGDPFALDDPSGQPRWLSSVGLTVHPALAPELLPPAGVVQGG